MPAEPSPEGWGGDPLTSFLEAAYRNRWASFANKQAESRLLIRIDHCFLAVLSEWRDPAVPVAALLAYRSHAAFRAACEHAMAGQVNEAFPLVRLTLECAGYALHIAKNPHLAEAWLRRHDGDPAMATVLKDFASGKVRKSIKDGDPKTEEVYGQLYQRAIDFGAHPNERAVTSSLSISKREAGTDYRQAYLVGDSLALDHALKSLAQASVCALNILYIAYPERFAAVGMADEPFELRKGL